MIEHVERKRVSWLLCALVGLSALHGRWALAAGELVVTVTPVKSAFVLGEPIYVDVALANRGEGVLEVSDNPLMAGTLIRILSPGRGEPVVWSKGGGSGVVRYRTLLARETLRDRALISHDFPLYKFPVAGTYHVWAEYAEGGIHATSEAVEVVVTEPTGVDAEVKEMLFSEPGQSFITHGGYTFPGQRGITPAIADFERIVSDYPASTYAPYAAYYLALRKSKLGRYSLGPQQPSDPIPPDYARSLELSRFAEGRAAFPLKAEARLLQAECSLGLGDTKKANTMLQAVGSLPGLAERKRAEALMAKLIQEGQ